MIVKRPSSAVSGKAMTGLDQVDKAAKAGTLPTGLKKNGMSFKGVIDLPDLAVTNVDGAGKVSTHGAALRLLNIRSDFHLYMENSPQDQSDRWSGRPFRAYTVVHPPSPPNLDPVMAQSDKHRFLDNVWTAQAMLRTRQSRSIVLCSPEKEVEARGGRVTLARTFFNIYQRTAFLTEPKKVSSFCTPICPKPSL